MTVHVLDTGAVYVLLNKHRPPLLATLEEASNEGHAIWMPAPVLLEVFQANDHGKRRFETLRRDLAPVAELLERHALRAADALRAVPRERCRECKSPVGPGLVDAAVMAFAAEYAEADTTIVYHQDTGDLEKLRDACFKKVQLQRV